MDGDKCLAVFTLIVGLFLIYYLFIKNSIIDNFYAQELGEQTPNSIQVQLGNNSQKPILHWASNCDQCSEQSGGG